MKKWFAAITFFLLCYVFFLIANLPVTSVLSQVTLPKNVSMSGIRGTVWAFTVDKAKYQNVIIEKIEGSLSVTSLLALDPQVSIAFGDPMLPGPEGKLKVDGLLSELHVFDGKIEVSADVVVQQFPLPLEMNAHDFIELSINNFYAGTGLCKEIDGQVSWRKAALTVPAFEQKVELGKLAANIGCDNGAVVFDIDQNNDLGLQFSAYVRQGGKMSGDGFLTPGEAFPENLKPVLSFIGRPDAQGRYRLRL